MSFPSPIRFWSKVSMPEEGCWLWSSKTDDDGYGIVMDGDKRLRAHRVAFVLAGGALAPSDKVLHRCDNPPCVRPSHLRKGTQQNNLADMVAKGRRGRTGPKNPLRGKDHPNYKHGRRSKYVGD